MLGTFGPLAGFDDEPAGVEIAWEPGSARIGDDTVPLPFLDVPLHWTLVRAGYLVAMPWIRKNSGSSRVPHEPRGHYRQPLDELWRELRRAWPLAQAHWSRFLLFAIRGKTRPSRAWPRSTCGHAR